MTCTSSGRHPQRPRTNAADLSQIDAAIGSLAPRLTRPCTVIGKSTVPVGTAENVRARLQAVAPAGADVDLVWNREPSARGSPSPTP